MRVLILNDYAEAAGGAERVTGLLRDGLRARGHDARLLASTASTGVAVGASEYPCFGTTSGARTLLRTVNPDAVRVLRRALADFRPDVVHVRMFMTQLSPAILPLLRRLPALYHAAWYESICPKGTKLLPDGRSCHRPAGIACRQEGCLSRRAWPALIAQQRAWRALDPFDTVVANSEFTRRRLAAAGVAPAYVIPNGVADAPPRPPLGDVPVVAYAGRLVAEKGVDVLVRAFAGARRAVPDASLWIFGSGPQRDRLERLAADCGAGDAVRFFGHLDATQLEEHLRRAWLQAVPSVWEEPFGLAAAEALSRGTAVVASDTGGLREVLAGGAGRLVAPGAEGPLEAALTELLTDRERADALGARGREVARERLGADRFVERFLSLYVRMTTGAETGR